MEREPLQLQREARRQAKDEQLCGLTPRAQQVCLAIYILSGFELDAAEAFVHESRKCRKRLLSDEALASDIQQKIQDWFRNFPFERLCELQMPSTDCIKDQLIHQEAVKFVGKWQAAGWIAEQNYKLILAPTYDALVHKYHEVLEKHGCGHMAARLLSVDGKSGAAGRAARAWCGRFCKQFAFSRKHLGIGSEMPAAELEDKADGSGVQYMYMFAKACRPVYFVFRGDTWSPFWDVFWVPFWVPFWGPFRDPIQGPIGKRS